jgi:hypothetical protein
MTDQEMARAIGERIIALRHQRAAFVGVLASLKTEEGPLPFRLMAREVLEGPSSRQSAAEQSLSLQLLIEPQVDCQATLRALYRFVFEEADEI